MSPPVLAGVITMIISDRHSNRPSLDPLRGGDLFIIPVIMNYISLFYIILAQLIVFNKQSSTT